MIKYITCYVVFFALACQLTAQTKAGKMDTMKRTTYYPCSNLPGTLQQKEKERSLITGNTPGRVCVPAGKRRVLNYAAKEQMKAAIMNGE